jgi:transcriptional regulator with XRE-family HTH domain
MESADTVTIPRFELPHRLARSLEWSGVTKIQMADALGVSRQTIDNYIKGRTIPTRGYLRAWADECRIPFDWLAFGDAVTDPNTHGDYASSDFSDIDSPWAA